MTKDKATIIKDQESIGNIQITYEEWIKISDEGEISIHCSDEYLYFKPKPEDRRVFENDTYQIVIKENGMEIMEKRLEEYMHFDKGKSLELLKQAIKEAERQGLWNTDGVSHSDGASE